MKTNPKKGHWAIWVFAGIITLIAPPLGLGAIISYILWLKKQPEGEPAKETKPEERLNVQ